MKHRVLWVEDSARFELNNLMGLVYFSGEYDFNLADDVTKAVHFLTAVSFDAVIVDIRLPPGGDLYWQKLYREALTGDVKKQLGVRLLEWMFSKDGNCPHKPPAWMQPHCIGVFTVESQQDIQTTLDELKIPIYKRKLAGMPDTVLMDLIQEILSQKVHPA